MQGCNDAQRCSATDLHVQCQCLVTLTTLSIQLSSCIQVAPCLIVCCHSDAIFTGGVKTHGADVGIHLSVCLCHLKGLLRLPGYQKELHSSLHMIASCQMGVQYIGTDNKGFSCDKVFKA